MSYFSTDITEKSGRIIPGSIISQEKRPSDGSRSMPREQSTVNSIQSPSLFNRNLTVDKKSTRLRSMHGKYTLSVLNFLI